MDNKSIDDVHRANRGKYRKHIEERRKPAGIFFSIIVGGVIAFLYWSFPESPLIAGAFIGTLLIVFSFAVPPLLRLLKFADSKLMTVLSVIGLTIVTFLLVSVFS